VSRKTTENISHNNWWPAWDSICQTHYCWVNLHSFRGCHYDFI